MTLASVLDQRRVNLLVIVVDDASTENVEDQVAGFKDVRARVVRHSAPMGVSAARNTGWSNATTPWVAFCDDDDLWSPDKLWRQLEAAESTGAAWAYAGCVHVNAELVSQNSQPPLPPAEMTAALFRYNAMPAGASNVIVRTAVLQHVGGFDPTLTHLPDWDLWVRLARYGAPACVSEPLVAYRIHGGNASFRTAQMLAEFDGFERRHGLTADRSRFHRHLAHLCMRSGRRLEALGHFAHALIRVQDGLSAVDIRTDVRLVREHAAEVLRRRFGLFRSDRAARRLEAARRRDPHRTWKAQAEPWLSELAARRIGTSSRGVS